MFAILIMKFSENIYNNTPHLKDNLFLVTLDELIVLPIDWKQINLNQLLNDSIMAN